MAKKITIADLNRVYSEIDINQFFNEDYCDYAIYRALQRIPNLLDGFAQTQRKIVYTMLDKDITKKTKVNDLGSLVSIHTKYHHGNMSIESTLTNLVPKYNNQVPLLKEDGSYGTRSDRAASASRYIESRLYKYSKTMFNEIDNKFFVTTQEVENVKIEPVSLIPILPMIFINGNSQIGVGYSCDVLPRKVETIIELFKDILTGKRTDIPAQIPPMIPLFKGTIESNGKGGWIFKGVVKENPKKDEVEILEVPPKYTRDKFIDVLEDLKTSGKIKSYSENINGDNFYVNVKLLDGWTKTRKNHEPDAAKRYNDLIELFSLTEATTENITLINTQNKIVKYDGIAPVIAEYLKYMLGIYKKRKEYLLVQLEREINIANERVRFIKYIIDETIIVKKKRQDEVVEQLLSNNFIKIDDSYNYLLRMPIHSMTLEKIKELEDEAAACLLRYTNLKNTTIANLWLDDINVFEEYYKKGE